jgi:hypothetical protein
VLLWRPGVSAKYSLSQIQLEHCKLYFASSPGKAAYVQSKQWLQWRAVGDIICHHLCTCALLHTPPVTATHASPAYCVQSPFYSREDFVSALYVGLGVLQCTSARELSLADDADK